MVASSGDCRPELFESLGRLAVASDDGGRLDAGLGFWRSLGFSGSPDRATDPDFRPSGSVLPVDGLFRRGRRPGGFLGPDHVKFRAGLKRLLFEERISPDRARSIRKKYASFPASIIEEEVLLNPVTGDDFPVGAAGRFPGCGRTRVARMLVGADARALEEAEEACGSAPGPNRDRSLGLLLGYPACCVEHYVECGARANSYLFYRSLLNSDGTLDSRLVGSIEYFPCSFGCPRSVLQAEAAWRLYRRTYPAWFRTLWKARRIPRLFFHAEFCVFFPHSSFARGRLVYRPPVYATLPRDPRRSTRYRQELLRPLLAGDSVESDTLELRISRGRRVVCRFPKAYPWINPLLVFH